jgi:hypothetical protein
MFAEHCVSRKAASQLHRNKETAPARGRLSSDALGRVEARSMNEQFIVSRAALETKEKLCILTLYNTTEGRLRLKAMSVLA